MNGQPLDHGQASGVDEDGDYGHAGVLLCRDLSLPSQLFRRIDHGRIQRDQRYHVIPKIRDNGRIGLQRRNGARLG
jgi:hypothetical protein